MTAAKLLIIDDDRDFAEGLAEALELHGYQVGIAFTGEEGVEAVEKDDFDTILIDIGLPGLNGVESLLKIRQVDPKARCFLLTGHSADHIAKQGIEAGATEILTKPIDPEDMLRRLSNTETRN